MKKILIIDDDKDILAVVDLLLSSNDFIVETEYRWQNTFHKIDSFNPDLILLDVSLGGEDGRHICKQVKSKEESKHIPVILFSANLNMERNYKEFIADDFIGKPFEIREMLNKIHSNT